MVLTSNCHLTCPLFKTVFTFQTYHCSPEPALNRCTPCIFFSSSVGYPPSQSPKGCDDHPYCACFGGDVGFFYHFAQHK
ncbi:hypothetical protein CY34DRAFT_593574 [Suillus luteus UH-Slu-Lm8-n1]|uniref:Uncharacterized protein n=1 Tax=Suillus luteus UH-Slu-Lm8-n1 TaxID=930992 RepID=A0A0D0BF97_9AGAM|nr:hypothetical protein CY34DRAFT_593574 [Suillus luteus UH-Slu-Lm8-n1]